MEVPTLLPPGLVFSKHKSLLSLYFFQGENVSQAAHRYRLNFVLHRSLVRLHTETFFSFLEISICLAKHTYDQMLYTFISKIVYLYILIKFFLSMTQLRPEPFSMTISSFPR
jgi:hypothetical protein